jgi:prophage tail gpP-like protein
MPEDGDEGAEDATAGLVGAPAYDTAIRKTRVLVTLPDSATNDDQLKQMAIWEANIRRARSRTYAATTEGMENPSTRKLFDINQLVHIKDLTNGISAQMLVKQLTYSLDVSGGTSTAFSCVDKDAYSLELNEPVFTVAVYEEVGDP